MVTRFSVNSGITRLKPFIVGLQGNDFHHKVGSEAKLSFPPLLPPCLLFLWPVWAPSRPPRAPPLPPPRPPRPPLRSPRSPRSSNSSSPPPISKPIRFMPALALIEWLSFLVKTASICLTRPTWETLRASVATCFFLSAASLTEAACLVLRYSS